MLAIGHAGTAPCICTEALGPVLLDVKADCPVTGPADGVTEVAFSPDGNRVVSGSSDSLVQIWDAKTGAEVRSFGGGRSGGGRLRSSGVASRRLFLE